MENMDIKIVNVCVNKMKKEEVCPRCKALREIVCKGYCASCYQTIRKGIRENKYPRVNFMKSRDWVEQ